MKRRDVFKIIFSPSTTYIVPGKTNCVSRYPEDNKLATANKDQNKRYCVSSLYDTVIVEDTPIGYRKSVEVQPVKMEAEKAIQLLPLRVSAFNQRISLTVSLKFPISTSLINERNDYAFVQFGIDAAGTPNCHSEVRIGITRSGVAFIGRKKCVIPDPDTTLRGGIRLRISIWLRPGNSFVKLSCLDRYDNTLCLLTTDEYSSNNWLGSVALVSKSFWKKKGNPEVVFNDFEFDNLSI